MKRSSKQPWYLSRGRPGILALALIALLGITILLITFGALQPGQTAPSNEFVVRIAPFTVDGQSDRTGMIVAEQLGDELSQRMTMPVNISVLDIEVTSPDAAEAAARRNGAEVILWGETLAGSTATTPGLRPHLTWLPDAPWEPRDWQGYDGHLVLPRHFDLAAAPLNGAAVLPPLLDSLVLFSRGDVDQAALRLATLERDYEDVLRAELPAVLQAIILWAEGRFPESTLEARRALQAAPRAEHWNNVGALLLDQQQPASEALLRAVAADPALVAPHLNLGRLLMNEGRPAEALPDLRTAAQSDGRPIVLASLAEALRRSGELGKAREMLATVLALEPNNGPALMESALLALTPSLTVTGRLEWELEAAPQRTAEQLDTIRAEAQRGVAIIEERRKEYLRRATAYGASNRPTMQRFMETQARRLEEELLNRDYQLVVVIIEQGRLHQRRQRSSLRRFWDALRGRRTPLEEAVILAEATMEKAPGGLPQYDLLYQRGRAAYLRGDPRTAGEAWEAAVELARNASADTRLAARPEAWYGQARLRLDRGERAEAVADLQQALAADGSFFPARELLANIAIADQQWDEAEPQLRWLAQQRPSAATTLQLATVLREQGRLKEAEALLLPLANQNDTSSLVLLARMYREAGQLGAADDALGRALTVEPGSAAALEEQALVEIARPEPDYGRVEDLLRRSVAADPGRTSAYIELGKLLGNVLGKPGAAAQAFQSAVVSGSNDPLTYRELGETLLASGAPQAAAGSFERALRLSPTSHEAQHGLAAAYLAQGRLDLAADAEQKALDLAGGNYTLAIVGQGDIALAREAYDEAGERYAAALERDPQVAGAYLGLGKIAAARGDWAIARGHYSRGIDANPADVRLLLALGQAQLATADTAGALQSFGSVKRIAPDNSAAYLGAARALQAKGRLDDALQELATATLRNPNDAEALVVIGDVQAALGQTEQALQAYDQAAKVRKDWFEPHFRRGVLLLAEDQQGPAIAELETAVRLSDTSAESLYWLGRAYRAAGDYANAIRQFQRATEIRPDYYEARFYLGRTWNESGTGADAIATYSALIAEAPAGDPWRLEAERELARIQ